MSLLWKLVLCVVCAFAPLPSQAQTWNAKYVRIVVPMAPGGASDVFARLLAQRLSERIGLQFIVENKPGAATTIAAAEVARSPADGATLMLAPAPFVISSLMYPKLSYTDKDFTGIALIATAPMVFTATKSVAVNTMSDVLAMAKAKPGSFTYASPGIGSVPHLATELLKMRTGIDIIHVPYKGGGPAVNDLVAGHIQLMFASPLEVSQLVAAGQLKYLALSTSVRNPSIPDIPTVEEAIGVKDFNVEAWFGIVAPAATPRPIVERLSREIGEILADPDVKERFAAQGGDIRFMPAQEFDRFLANERDLWGRAVKASGAKVE
jgi:tripartite-type tricarboxylate transporter receptor subunit TctC